MPRDIDLTAINGLGFDFSQYFGLWMVEETSFFALCDRVASMDLVAHVHSPAAQAQIKAAAGNQEYERHKNVAVIDINGTMTKKGSSLSDAGSTVRIRQVIRAAGHDEDISGIVLRIDSPGGTVSGTSDLGSDVASVAARKPVVAFIEDMGASAAYWVASQASSVFAANPTTLVGSIGTYMGMYDLSGAAAMKGIRPVLIKSGAYKGAGFEGTEISEEVKADWQRKIDQLQAAFNAAVATGRHLPLSVVEQLADGRVHLAAEAKRMGLIDGIMGFDAAVAKLQEFAGRPRGRTMSQVLYTSTGGILTNIKPIEANEPANLDQLRAACPGADPAFLLAQIDAKATVEAAQKAFIVAQEAKIAAERKAREDAEAKAAKPGVEPLGSKAAEASDDDPLSQWNEKIAKKQASGMKRPAAVKAVAHENPELQQAVVEAANANRRR